MHRLTADRSPADHTTSTTWAGSPAPVSAPDRPAGVGQRGRRPRLVLAAVALATAAGLLGGAAGAGVATALGDDTGSSTTTVSRGAAVSNTATATGAVESAAATIAPSVVTIAVTASPSGTSRQVAGTGSGVIISTDGYILTNNHVISGAGGRAALEVTFDDGSTAAATVIGTDPSSDLAVIKVDGVDDLVAASFADVAELRIGQDVVAVGSPLGLGGTVTAGIISALDRPVRTGGSGADPTTTVIDAVQTDAAINPGNSGGPLVDLAGRIVGINTAIASLSAGAGQKSGNIGVGFAIPADTAADVADQLIADGTAEHASLGVSVSDDPAGNGAVLQDVVDGSAASAAGLRPADVVTEVAGRAVRDVDDLIAAVRDHDPGDTITVRYDRGGQNATASVVLDGRAG
jgi:putative serine protease PepD